MSRRTRKEKRSIATAVPEGWRVYVFGSALCSQQPSDLDLLCVYDPKRVVPSAAYDQIRLLARALTDALNAQVDLTVLSDSEAVETDFVSKEHCVMLDDLLRITWLTGLKTKRG